MKPGDVKNIEGKYKICKVGAFTLPNGDIETRLKWYLPRTRADRFRVINLKTLFYF